MDYVAFCPFLGIHLGSPKSHTLTKQNGHFPGSPIQIILCMYHTIIIIITV